LEISLKACRVNANMEQESWAKELGVTLNTISNWERGKTEPTLNQLRKISELSGIPIDYIVMPSDSDKMNTTK